VKKQSVGGVFLTTWHCMLSAEWTKTFLEPFNCKLITLLTELTNRSHPVYKAYLRYRNHTFSCNTVSSVHHMAHNMICIFHNNSLYLHMCLYHQLHLHKKWKKLHKLKKNNNNAVSTILSTFLTQYFKGRKCAEESVCGSAEPQNLYVFAEKNFCGW